MRVILIFLLSLIFTVNAVYSYEIVLPKSKKNVVTDNYAFFVGNADKSEIVTINDERVNLVSNGAFAHSVKLKDGENRIFVQSNFKTEVYKFYKSKKEEVAQVSLIEFEPKNFEVKSDNTPLRSVPLNYGMNRLSHLYAGTNLIINGEKGDFYRVFLSKDKSAWISKDAVLEKDTVDDVPKFLSMYSKAYKNASNHTIEFTGKLPYTVEEVEQEIVFKVYNPQKSDDTVYTINIKKPEKYSYKIKLCNGTYNIKLKELTKPETLTLDGLIIAVDAGHGGLEKGAEGCFADKEKDINLQVAQELKNILTLMGAKVIMTRDADRTVSLNDRVELAKDNLSEIFVSIHLNSIPDIPINIHKNRGTSVYYYNNQSKDLAEKVQKSVVKELKTKNEGVKTASFAVLRPTDYIGILVELAYMTNPLDSVIYKEELFAKDSAKAIADGILEYVNSQN